VCLDEMNLARVEYYLADCLSAMESGNPLHLDTRDTSAVPNTVKWPGNLYLFGTVNVDESTLKISDKVLDRAQVIDTSDIDLLPQLKKWLDGATALDQAERDKCLSIVGGVWTVLKAVQAHFGFRTGKAVARFVNEAKASSGAVMSVDDAIDAQLCHKILVKLRGEGDRWAEPLSKLEVLLDKLEGKKSAKAIVSRMRNDLERLGSFQFWN
jgi:5-methylcytosine-specific restriction protein B